MGRSGGERSYLSIREVLDLLVEEFPDVTISKIRFLESRGLIHPERTPSGYRKFYDPDVERLRWILRQQREHFLPLKVIKGRLEGDLTALPASPSLFDETDDADEVGDEVPVGAGGSEVEGPRELVASHIGAPAPASESGFTVRRDANGLGRHSRHALAAAATAPAQTAEAEREPEPMVAPAPAGGAAAAQRTVRVTDEDPGLSARGPWGERASLHPSPAGASLPGARAEGSRRPATVRSVPASAARLSDDEPTGGTGGRAGHPSAGPRIARAGARAAAVAGAADPAPEVQAPTPPADRAAPTPASLVSGASLTAEELAASIGEGVELVAELEEFGLIAGRDIAGVRCYDEEALVVARIAAGFRRFGIESRHLKTFKHAAEREASLFGQVVTPLLRQRNPAARERAYGDLAELSELGSSLQAALLRAELRDLTGG